jgi:hypothetical protein
MLCLYTQHVLLWQVGGMSQWTCLTATSGCNLCMHRPSRGHKWKGSLHAPHVFLTQVDDISACTTRLAVTSGRDLCMHHTPCCHKWMGSLHAPQVFLSQVNGISACTTRLAVTSEWHVCMHHTSSCHNGLESVHALNILLSQLDGISSFIKVLPSSVEHIHIQHILRVASSTAPQTLLPGVGDILI